MTKITKIYNVSPNHRRYVLVKSEPFTDKWWYECTSDDLNWINNRAEEVKDYCDGMWVWIIDTTEEEIPVGIL